MTGLVREFGRTVRRLREANAWSQEQLAEYAGLNRSYISEIERGTVIASIATLDKLAHAFAVSAASMLDSHAGVPSGDPAALPQCGASPPTSDERRIES